jgi:GT2 family glycosyltransferase
MCVDGWCLTTPQGGDLRARLTGSDDTDEMPWSILFRKHRPDVASHFYGGADYAGGAAHLGFFGHIRGTGRKRRPTRLELRDDERSWSVPLGTPVAEAVPEEAFFGLVIDVDGITPGSIASLASVMRHSLAKPLPLVTTAYAHVSLAGPAKVNIVVPTYGDFTYLRNLVLALADAPTGAVEATVVCDDPRIVDDLVRWTTQWNDAVYGGPVRVLVHDQNSGFAAACNSGWQSSRCSHQLLLNSDVIVDSLVADVTRMSALLVDGVVAVAPVLLFPDGTLQHDGMRMEEPAHLPGFTLPAHPGKGQPPPTRSEPFEVDLLTGAAILTTTSVLRAVGGLPSVYGRGDFEDVLLSVAMARLGRLMVDPAVRWTHVEAASYDRDQHGGLPVTLAKSMVVAERLEARS